MYELFTAKQIGSRVWELGQWITRSFKGRELVVIPVLNGSFMFAADLVREIDLPMRIEFLDAKSYGHAQESSGSVKIEQGLLDRLRLRGEHVLLVEDIVDTGLTIGAVSHRVTERGAASVSVCALLDKPKRRKAPVVVDYAGFTIDDLFVYGYGLDLEGRERNLPSIFVKD